MHRWGWRRGKREARGKGVGWPMGARHACFVLCMYVGDAFGQKGVLGSSSSTQRQHNASFEAKEQCTPAREGCINPSAIPYPTHTGTYQQGTPGARRPLRRPGACLPAPPAAPNPAAAL